MRKLYFAALAALSVQTPIFGEENIVESYSYASDEYIEKCINVPVVRKINGGTVFKIKYEGNWSSDMKGAFEYACKLWEENLPNSLPINITAKVGKIRTSGECPLSQVGFRFYNMRDGRNEQRSSLLSQIKSVVLRETEIYGRASQFASAIPDSTFFDAPDITITYNKERLGEFSFSLEAEPTNKYDFITVALRDIAKGLGFYCGFHSDDGIKIDLPNNRFLTPYECSIPNNDSARNGYYTLNIEGYGSLDLYAPNVWEDNVSMNYFIPDSTKKLTELLSYDFGKGCVIRDITDKKYTKLFDNLLGWSPAILVGGTSNGINGSGSTGNVIPYEGSIDASDLQAPISDSVTELHLDNGIALMSDYTDQFDEYSYCWPYMSQYNNRGYTFNGYYASLLKKDGTWDVIWSSYGLSGSIDIKSSNFHEPIANYSRTADGYLRCRVTHCDSEFTSLGVVNTATAKYYVIDCLPQKVELSYDGSISKGSTSPIASLSNDGSAIALSTSIAKIGMKNLEGIERVYVECLEEGDRVPTRYEITDFKKGYFTFEVYNQLDTKFKVIAYNKNGSSTSDDLIVNPWYASSKVDIGDVKIGDDLIEIDPKDPFFGNLNLKSYEIAPIVDCTGGTILSGKIEDDKAQIDISKLNKGLYVLNLLTHTNNKFSIKFNKK